MQEALALLLMSLPQTPEGQVLGSEWLRLALGLLKPEVFSHHRL